MTTTDKTYNGWANYPTWVTKLWMDNEQGSYLYGQEIAAQAWDEAEPDDICTKSQRARFNLADRLKDEYEEAMQDMLEASNQQASVWGDLLGAALSEVNWDEIANSLLEDHDGIEGYVSRD